MSECQQAINPQVVTYGSSGVQPIPNQYVAPAPPMYDPRLAMQCKARRFTDEGGKFVLRHSNVRVHLILCVLIASMLPIIIVMSWSVAQISCIAGCSVLVILIFILLIKLAWYELTFCDDTRTVHYTLSGCASKNVVVKYDDIVSVLATASGNRRVQYTYALATIGSGNLLFLRTKDCYEESEFNAFIQERKMGFVNIPATHPPAPHPPAPSAPLAPSAPSAAAPLTNSNYQSYATIAVGIPVSQAPADM